jgi:diguanylate cyclase (GGDEF)-like protein
MDIPIRPKGKPRAKEIFSSYGDLADRLLPAALRISFYGAEGELEWTRGGDKAAPAHPPSIVRAIIPGGSLEPQVSRLGESLVAVAIPILLDSKPVSILLVDMPCDKSASDRRLMRDIAGAAAPLVDCLCRELAQQVRKALPSATLSERTEELEWLFALTENLHSNSSDPRAISQLLGAAVERMRACFGAVVVPDHGLELTYSSMVRIDMQSAGIFERCKPYFMNFVQRRKQPLIANKVSAGTNMPPFKVLVLPIEPHKGKVIGYLVFLKSASLPGFGRRQLFLGRHIGHQVGALLESQYDLATGLLTRNAFEQDVQRMNQPLTAETANSLVYFDIDRLHVINDVLGFAHGDEAIVRIADLFRAPALPHDAITSRIGGDSFVVYLPNHDAEQAYSRALEILKSATECTIGPEDKSASLSLSCGVVRLYSSENGLGGPIATAQMACASAKERGGNRVEIYLDVDASMIRRRHDIFEVSKLRSALTEGNFCIYAQKIVAAGSLHDVRSMECLVRMVGDDGSIIAPGEFMPSAHRYQMMHAIDHWVISNTLKEIKPYRTLLFQARISVAINISGQSIQDEVFVEAIERWLAESLIAPGLIVFEITETAAISNLARAERLIRRLRQHGCRFSLDDFGTGVNSLSYLKTLPVASVKIDGSFTRDLLTNSRSDVMVQTIVQMSKSLGIECVAECVESLAVAERVRALGVDYVQGFVVHRPEPLKDLLESLKTDESKRLRQLFLNE